MPRHLDTVDDNIRVAPGGTIALGEDVPPPGYTEFYGWHEGRFYGLHVIDPDQLLRYRQEGRWFDEWGYEYPRWDDRGRPLSPYYRETRGYSPEGRNGKFYGQEYHRDPWHNKNYETQKDRAIPKQIGLIGFAAIIPALPVIVIILFVLGGAAFHGLFH